MKKIVSAIRDHWQKDFQPVKYGFILLFLITALALNVKFKIEDDIIDAYLGKPIRMFFYFLLYATAWYGAAIIVFHFSKVNHFWKDKRFWLFSLFGLGILSMSAGFPYYRIIQDKFIPVQYYYYSMTCLVNAKSLFTIYMPLYLFYRYNKGNHESFYGLTYLNTDVRPYAWMLLMMIPLISWASFQEDFTTYYPTCKPEMLDIVPMFPRWLSAGFYEFVYGTDFISVELIFRGFFVIGMTHILGRHAVLPMVVLYACYHFGKPLGEAIGSIGGGYILGVIALYSRNIWGGVCIHLGVAYLMELGAYLQITHGNGGVH